MAAANALAYAASTANWVPTSDNWFYLDRIVHAYAHGQFSFDELLVKRGAFDHSQPLRRLLRPWRKSHERSCTDWHYESSQGEAL